MLSKPCKIMAFPLEDSGFVMGCLGVLCSDDNARCAGAGPSECLQYSPLSTLPTTHQPNCTLQPLTWPVYCQCADRARIESSLAVTEACNPPLAQAAGAGSTSAPRIGGWQVPAGITASVLPAGITASALGHSALRTRGRLTRSKNTKSRRQRSMELIWKAQAVLLIWFAVHGLWLRASPRRRCLYTS